MKYIIVFITALFFTINAYAQQQGSAWKTLSMVTFKMEFDEFMAMDVQKPIYTQHVMDLSGEEITVKGYIIPLKGEKAQSHFMFSAYPYKMCFFCGNAGPETVLQAFTKDKVKVPYTSKAITIKGKLSLNHGDVNELMYTLTNVVVVE